MLAEQSRLAVQALQEFTKHLAHDADALLSSGNREAARCAGVWLRRWADGDALLGRMAGDISEIERVFALSGMALGYVHVRDVLDPDDRAVIDRWLVRLGSETRRSFEARLPDLRNNIRVWLALDLAAIGMATRDPGLRASGRDLQAEALARIGPDGSVAAERARGAAALSYHAYTLLPLVMLAELGVRDGRDAYGDAGGALHRLVRFVADGMRDPRALSRATGAVQQPVASQDLAWKAFYARRFPDRAAALGLSADGAYWRADLGGDVTALARRWVR